MRSVLLLLLLCFQAHAFAQSAVGAEWATAISSHPSSDRKIVLRYIKQFQPTFNRTLFSDRIIITWRYTSDSGMPSKADSERMNLLEDLLQPVTEGAGLAGLVLVSTGENLREWIYYAQSEESFFRALNSALAAQARFPVQIHAAKDSSWSTYERFRAGVRE